MTVRKDETMEFPIPVEPSQSASLVKEWLRVSWALLFGWFR